MITEQQVKELVNGLIDLKEDNAHGFNDEAFFMRKHGIEMAISRINSKLLNQPFRSENQKHFTETPILKVVS